MNWLDALMDDLSPEQLDQIRQTVDKALDDAPPYHHAVHDPLNIAGLIQELNDSGASP